MLVFLDRISKNIEKLKRLLQRVDCETCDFRAKFADLYFVNRLDRYLMIERAGPLAEFASDLIDVLARHAFRLRPDYSLEPPSAAANFLTCIFLCITFFIYRFYSLANM